MLESETVMAYAPHTLVQLSGSLLGGSDGWSCSIRKAETTDDNDAYLAVIAPLLATWFADATNFMANQATLEVVKSNNIGADGHYSDGVTHQHDYPGSGIVGGVSATLPAECSLVTSWVTPLTRGPASKGRIYLPNFSVPLSDAGISGTTVGAALSVANAGAKLINILNTGGSDLNKCSVISKIGAAVQQITSVRVGHTIDVQRRRRNSTPEIYTPNTTAIT